jgi:hypothetical protein
MSSAHASASAPRPTHDSCTPTHSPNPAAHTPATASRVASSAGPRGTASKHVARPATHPSRVPLPAPACARQLRCAAMQQAAPSVVHLQRKSSTHAPYLVNGEGGYSGGLAQYQFALRALPDLRARLDMRPGSTCGPGSVCFADASPSRWLGKAQPVAWPGNARIAGQSRRSRSNRRSRRSRRRSGCSPEARRIYSGGLHGYTSTGKTAGPRPPRERLAAEHGLGLSAGCKPFQQHRTPFASSTR